MEAIVRKQTSSNLQLTLRPNGLILFLAGLVFIGMGLIAMHLLGHHAVFAVKNGELRYERTSLLRLDPVGFTLPVDSVANISVVSREGLSSSDEVVVESAGEVLETAFLSVDGEGKRQIAGQSREAISREGGTFFYEEDARLLAILLGAVCVAGGLICWLSMQVVTISADRDRGTFLLHRRRLLLPRGDHHALRITEIRQVRVVAETLDTVKHQVTSYQVYLDRRGGGSVAVAKGPMFTLTSAAALREILVAWLHLA